MTYTLPSPGEIVQVVGSNLLGFLWCLCSACLCFVRAYTGAHNHFTFILLAKPTSFQMVFVTNVLKNKGNLKDFKYMLAETAMYPCNL